MTLAISFEKFLENIDVIKQCSLQPKVLYKPTDMMTVDQFANIQNAKMKADFVPMPDMQDEALSSGYLIGRLTAEMASTVLITDSETLLSIGSIPAKNNATVYFVKDVKQAQKLEKSSATPAKRKSVKKETPAVREKKTRTVEEKKEDIDGFMNLPECNTEEKDEEREPEVEAFLKKNIGVAFTEKYYNAITKSAKKATEYVGWEILLRVEVMDRDVSAKIYEKLAPKFKELQNML